MSPRPQRPKSRPRPQPKSKGVPRRSPVPGRPFSPRPESKPSDGAARHDAPRPATLHIAPVDVLARESVAIAMEVEHAVYNEQRRADRAIAFALKDRRLLAAPDRRFLAQAIFALFRWQGWVDGLKLMRVEERLLLSWMLDAPTIHPVCRLWARVSGRDPGQAVALGDAPSWTARAEGLKRFAGGRTVNADPWRLFPDWFRANITLPEGAATPKARYLELLNALQLRAPLWVRAQGPAAAGVWDELQEAGLKPWIHRRILSAAKLETDADVYHLAPFTRGAMEIQDISSQAVALICDPDPGERWWDACAGAGGKSLHLAALMQGKGVVVATDSYEKRLTEAVRRARRSPFRNITTKHWDGTGKYVAGKAKSYDGVLLDAPCSALGVWRRNPDARWTTDPDSIPRLAELQGRLLQTASAGVKPGGTLVYSVCTFTMAETVETVRRFLEANETFHLDPFSHPFTGEEASGMLQIWPQDGDGDAMFVARMLRASGT